MEENRKRDIDNYNVIDSEIVKYVKDVLEGKEKDEVLTVAFLTEKAIKDIKNLTGLDVTGNRVVLDANAVKHIEKRHGINGEQDCSMSDINDFAKIGYIVNNYDNIYFNNKYSQIYRTSNNEPAPKLLLSKEIDDIYYVVEAVSDSKKHQNYIVSAYVVSNKK